MSDRFYGRRTTNPPGSFNESARPRTMDDRKHHHVVHKAPYYAQAAQLYPKQSHTGVPSDFRYRPTADIAMPGSGPPASTGYVYGRFGSSGGGGGSGGGVPIPVVHLDSPTSTYPGRSTSGSYVGLGGGGNYRSAGSGMVRRPSPAFGTSSTDPEAEVDALTDALMQKMEAPRSAGAGGIVSPHDEGRSSPVGSIRRGSGGTTSLTSRVARLQQQTTQQRVGSPSTVAAAGNNNNGSPLTLSSPHTSSPTNSSGSGGGSGANDTFLQNCFRCRRPLVPPESATLGPGSPTPPVVTLTGALAVRLHEACFTCYICRTKLNPQAYYHSLHRLLCPTCVRDGAVESCKNCKRPIGERIVRALGAPYHPGCFVCMVCHTNLDSKPFTVDVYGRPLCLEDFHRRHAPRCALCARPITPESGSQEARRVVAGNKDYHLYCYNMKTAAAAAAAAEESTASTPTPSSIPMATA